MISLLQVFRGLAALLVVYHHANHEVVEMFGQNPLRSLFDLGDAGVQFFFVLSGFIIYYVHRGDIGRPARAREFLLKRIIRVYPIYVLVTLVLTPFWAFVPGFGNWYHKELSSFIYSILLLPQPHVPNLGVAWTLTHEMLFYLLFTVVVLNLGIGRALFLGWFAVIAVAALLLPSEPAFPFSYLLSVNNLLFGMGILAAVIVTRRDDDRRGGLHLVALGAAAFMIVGVAGNLLVEAGAASDRFFRAKIILLGLASFLVVLQSGSESVEAVFRRRRLLNAIGAGSFSIYLIHQPVISLFRKAVELVGWQDALGEHLFFVLAMVVSVSAGMVMYYLLERPMLRYLSRRYIHSRRSAPSAAAVPTGG